MRRRWKGWMGAVLVLVATACGEDGPGVIGPDPSIAAFVGLWDAEVFVVSSVAQPVVVADLLINGTFWINIEPSGEYTATLEFGQLTPVIEFGQASVSGNFLRLNPTGGPAPCPAAAEYSFASADYVTLTSPTCFDFNLDGEDEDTELAQAWRRR